MAAIVRMHLNDETVKKVLGEYVVRLFQQNYVGQAVVKEITIDPIGTVDVLLQINDNLKQSYLLQQQAAWEEHAANQEKMSGNTSGSLRKANY